MDGGPPAFPRDSSCPAVLWILTAYLCFRVRGSHPLRPAFPCRSPNSVCLDVSPNPGKPEGLPVWPPPRSLATTCGISVDVFSSPYLDVSVQAVPRAGLFYSPCADTVLPYRVSPFGYLRIIAYVPLPEAFRSLSRPSSAPDAKAFPLRSFLLNQLFYRSLACSCSLNYAGFLPGSFLRNRYPLFQKFFLLLPCLSSFLCSVFNVHSLVPFWKQVSAPGASSVRSNLSSKKPGENLVGPSGLEPPTLRLSVVRSSQLS